MDLLKVKEINEVYKLKVKEENYENQKTMDIAIASSDVLQWGPLVGTEADVLAFGEFTRRFERAM